MYDVIITVAATLISLLIAYVPTFRTRFYALGVVQKRAVLLASLACAAGAVLTFSCLDVFRELATTCDKRGIEDVLRGFGVAVIASQATYQLIPDSRKQ
jgi:hypothetical protein